MNVSYQKLVFVREIRAALIGLTECSNSFTEEEKNYYGQISKISQQWSEKINQDISNSCEDLIGELDDYGQDMSQSFIEFDIENSKSLEKRIADLEILTERLNSDLIWAKEDIDNLYRRSE